MNAIDLSRVIDLLLAASAICMVIAFSVSTMAQSSPPVVMLVSHAHAVLR